MNRVNTDTPSLSSGYGRSQEGVDAETCDSAARRSVHRRLPSRFRKPRLAGAPTLTTTATMTVTITHEVTITLPAVTVRHHRRTFTETVAGALPDRQTPPMSTSRGVGRIGRPLTMTAQRWFKRA